MTTITWMYILVFSLGNSLKIPENPYVQEGAIWGVFEKYDDCRFKRDEYNNTLKKLSTPITAYCLQTILIPHDPKFIGPSR
jgi:hypothetical protein